MTAPARPTPPVEHELKTWPEFFAHLLTGEKTFELRKDDRGFRVGHILWLREWSPKTGQYSGRELRYRVTYVLSGLGLEPDMVVMGLAPAHPPSPSPLVEAPGWRSLLFALVTAWDADDDMEHMLAVYKAREALGLKLAEGEDDESEVLRANGLL